MYRNVISELSSWWVEKPLKPLLLRGARQVGKSYLVESYWRERLKADLLVFDFEAQPALKRIFEEDKTPESIVPKLELMANRTISDEHSLLFFDEIQTCPEALMSLRYFFERRPNLHVIAAGSLLDFTLQDVSFPVGRVRSLNVYPMGFDEFLLACGRDKLQAVVTSPPRPLGNTEHQLLLDAYREYLFVGGLPEAVLTYSQSNSILKALRVQQDLVRMYEADFGKYAGRADINCLRQVLRGVALHLTKPLKYSHLSEDFSVPTVKKALNLLEMAQVVRRAPNVNPHGLPLGASASPKLFKIFLEDIGLLHALSGLSAQQEVNQKDLLDAYRGALAEQAVGQALVRQTENEVYTWYRPQQGSQAEVDYLISRDGEVIPIEVKSGPSGRLKSLHNFLREHPLARVGYVISTAPYEPADKNRIVRLPIYYSGTFLRHHQERHS